MAQSVQLSPGVAIEQVMKRFGCTKEAACDFIEFHHGHPDMPGWWEQTGVDELNLAESLGQVEARTVTAEELAAEQEAKKRKVTNPQKGKGGAPQQYDWGGLTAAFMEIVVEGKASEVFSACMRELEARAAERELSFPSETQLERLFARAHRVLKDSGKLKPVIPAHAKPGQGGK